MSKALDAMDWDEVIRRFRASGQSQVEFARREGISVHRLVYRLQLDGPRARASPPRFVPVGDSPRVVLHRGEVRLELPATVAPEYIAKLVDALS